MTDFSKASTSAWADNMDMGRLSATLKLNSSTVGTVQSKIEQKFWSTPARFGDSDTREVMEISLSATRLVNHITFEVAKFPHDVDLECFNEDTRAWEPVLQADPPRPEACRHSVEECYPPIIPSASSIEGENHPQHSFSGHWEGCEFITRPVRFQRLRIVLSRHTRGRHPCNSLGARIAFSLAIKSLYCGYKVYSKAVIPKAEPVLSSYTDRQTFASTTDLMGSAVDYSVRINSAENVLRNDPALIWRSEPQPFPWAVVNYYCDVRDGEGGPQVLDRFFLDPLNDGANVNLYYSNDEPDSAFKANDDPLNGNQAVINGTVGGTRPLSQDSAPVGRVNYVDVDNSKISFIPGARWWFGASLRWKFQRHLDNNDHPIFDCGLFHMAWTPFGLRFATTYGDHFYVDCDRFDPATDFRFISWYDDGKIKVKIRVNGKDYGGGRTLSVKIAKKTVTKIRLGGFFGTTVTHTSDFFLHSCVLKQDQYLSDQIISDYLGNPTSYAQKPEFTHDDDGRTDNAILRYYPDRPNPDYPSGFRGGGPTKYDAMEWSPIARDYVLRKGFMLFPPTKAKYWKFEFCGLIPEPYEVYVPVKKTVRTYRKEMWLVPTYPSSLWDRLPSFMPGIVSSISLSASISFKSSLNVSVNVNAGKGYTKTSVRVVAKTSLSVSIKASVSWSWGFVPCHKPVYVPRFEEKLVHEYDYIDVEQTTKTAFFVGLKGIQAFKVDYLSLDDSAQYEELFHDQGNMDSQSGWQLTEDHRLDSGDSRFSQAESRVFPSNRVVRAVQFAVTQSAPIQLLPDDDFDDPEHAAWESYGDGSLAPFGVQDSVIGSILRVDRSSREPSWGELQASTQYTAWHSFEDQNATWATVEDSGNPAQAQGGIQSKAVTTPPGGRIYAAARVVAPAELQSPLYVQIIDDETGRVLSETPQDVAANQITEWYTSYTIGEGGDVLAWRWKDFSTNPSFPTFLDAFQRANGVELGTMDTKQTWRNDGASHQIATNEALTSAAGQFDYVDSVTPWGTYEVVVGTMGTTGTDPLFDLLPIQVNDQGVLSHAGGRSALPTQSIINRALIASDDIRIDVLPMVHVPVNRRPADWVDNVSAPYALVVFLNGTWVKTIGHRMGARTRKGIRGRLNQRFRSFAWVPTSYGGLPGPSMWAIPVAGQGSFDSARLTWTDIDNNPWAVTGTVDNANATTPGVLIFTGAASTIVVDTRYWYGTLAAGVRHVADGTIGRHGMVLVLDADSRVFLDHAGNVVRDSVNYGNLVPGGITNNSHVAVSFMDTKSVAASIRGSIDPVAFPRMLVARVNGTVVGTLGNAFVQSWQGTRRGLAGDVFDGAPGATIADNHTSFDSFSWAPDASNVVIDPRTPKWDEVSQKSTGTYDSIAKYLTLNNGKLRARVIQRASSIDVWDMDALSLFANPIVWSFSNDGGLNYYPAYDIRNNPNGVLVFPENITVTAQTDAERAASASPGQALSWRVISYWPHSSVSSLVIRPWYGGLLSGITHRVGTATGGPNVMPYDHYPPIEGDARFQTWHQPIPKDWYWNFKVLSRTKDDVVPTPRVLLASEDLMTQYQHEIEGEP